MCETITIALYRTAPAIPRKVTSIRQKLSDSDVNDDRSSKFPHFSNTLGGNELSYKYASSKHPWVLKNVNPVT